MTIEDNDDTWEYSTEIITDAEMPCLKPSHKNLSNRLVRAEEALRQIDAELADGTIATRLGQAPSIIRARALLAAAGDTKNNETEG